MTTETKSFGDSRIYISNSRFNIRNSPRVALALGFDGLTHPQIPDIASTSKFNGPVGGAMVVVVGGWMGGVRRSTR